MSLHRLETVQKLPISIDKAWEFLSSPSNLKIITPPHMGFIIHSGFSEGEKMYAGMVINYTVKPVLGLPMSWVTEITHVEKPNYFVDEQRFGPYSFWHHKHFLKAIPGGVEMKDIIDYKSPFGPIGDLMNIILIKGQLKNIFDFRNKKLIEIFGEWKD